MTRKKNNEVTTTESNFDHASFLDKLWFGLTGNRYQYEVEIRYYWELYDNGNWNGDKYVSRIVQYGTCSQKSMMLDYRHDLHKALSTELMKDLPRDLLKNGKLQVARIDYLGRW